jgi:carbamoyl-phosphate synthase large subunit
LGFEIVATGGTWRFLADNGVAAKQVNKVAQGRPHIVDRIKDGAIAIVFNTTEGWQSHKDSASIRAAALMGKIPYFTTASSAVAVGQAISVLREHGLEVRSLQDYYSTSGA